MGIRFIYAVPAALVDAPRWTGDCHNRGLALASDTVPPRHLIPVCPTCPTVLKETSVMTSETRDSGEKAAPAPQNKMQGEPANKAAQKPVEKSA